MKQFKRPDKKFGNQIFWYTHCISTNQIAYQGLNEGNLTHGHVIVSDFQTAGKGQQNNKWVSAPNKNLTFSLVIKPGNLSVDNRFYLQIITALGILNLLDTYFEGSVIIKWPNDIRVDNKKICGILTECQIKNKIIEGAVIGIGLNVNQQDFDGNLSATSFYQFKGEDYDRQNILYELLDYIELYYQHLENGAFEYLMHEYLKHMLGYQAPKTYTDGEYTFTGIIEGIKEDGRVIISSHAGKKSYGIKEVKLVE